MLKKLSAVIFIVFIAVFILNYNAQSSVEEAVTITVKNNPIKKLLPEHNFVGVCWHGDSYKSDNINKIIFSDPEKLEKFINFFKKLNIDVIRYPGSADSANYYWDVSNEDIFKAWKQWSIKDPDVKYYSFSIPTGRVGLKDFLEFCKKANIKPIIQVNTHNYFDKKNNEIIRLKDYDRDSTGKRNWKNGRVNWLLVDKAAESAGRQVKWVKENSYSNVVGYWELGNEELIRDPESAAFTGKEYGLIAAKFIKTMKTANPDIKILLTGDARPSITNKYPDLYITHEFRNKWMNEVLQTNQLKDNNKNIFGVTQHTYFVNGIKDNLTDFKTYYDHIIKNPELDAGNRYEFHTNMLKANGYTDKKLFITEFNTNYDKNIWSHSWIAALGPAQVVLSGLNSPSCYHMDYFRLTKEFYKDPREYPNMGLGLMHYADDFPDPFIIYPVGNVIGLLNSAIKGKVLETGFDFNKTPSGVVQDDDLIKVIVLNKDKKRTVNIDLNSFPSFKFIKSESLGIGVSGDFRPIETGVNPVNPPEVKQLNILNNRITVKKDGSFFTAVMEPNIIAVITFKKDK